MYEAVRTPFFYVYSGSFRLLLILVILSVHLEGVWHMIGKYKHSFHMTSVILDIVNVINAYVIQTG